MYSELAYFDGFHFAHIALWEEHKRIAHRNRIAHAASCGFRKLGDA